MTVRLPTVWVVPPRSSWPPERLSGAEAALRMFSIRSTPPAIVVAPEKVFAPQRVTWPAPLLVKVALLPPRSAQMTASPAALLTT